MQVADYIFSRSCRFLGVFVVIMTAAQQLLAVEFNQSIAPIFIKRCLECHQGVDASGKLDLRSAESLQVGGESGTAIVARLPVESFLWQRVRDGEMPPAKQGKKQTLSAEEIELLRVWIAEGAKWPQGRTLDLFEATTEKRAGRDWWSLQPIQNPTPPTIRNSPSLVRSQVDAFVVEKLDARGWEYAPAADRRTLLRRVFYDLIGLPPTFEEVEAFVQDDAPDAFERVVDRLLASPRYGERWGRFWLDVVRYAETCGYERDQAKPNVWKYRDWVIRSFNQDLPLNRFILEQLAGDEIPDRSEQSLIATGFIRLGTWNDEPNDPQEYKYDRLEDMVHATSAAFLGLTVKCARCHDHKFDPISQEDYYRLAGAFWAGFIEPGARELLGGPDANALGIENVFGWTDRSPRPPPIRLLKKGEPKHPRGEVAPAHLSFVPRLNRPLEPPVPQAKTTGRRRQLAEWIGDSQNPLTARVWVNRLWHYHFGKGLVRSPDNFGYTGDKPTHPQLLDWLATRFLEGGNQEPQSTKWLQRMLVCSAVYRQSSLHPQQTKYAAEDANNLGWWRAERRRLDAEALRDSLLMASGRLDLGKASGPSFSPDIGEDAAEGLSRKSRAWKASSAAEQNRRSVFMFTQRSLLPPLATVFDFPDTTLPCGQRDVTTVAPQALAMLNNRFLHQQSEQMARRVLDETKSVMTNKTDETSLRVERVWQLALGRSPNGNEGAASFAHWEMQRKYFRPRHGDAEAGVLAWASLCHVLLNANEFVFVD